MRTKVTLSIEADVADEARALKVNMSRIAERAIAEANGAARNARWAAANRDALDRYADEIARDGLALDDLRLF